MIQPPERKPEPAAETPEYQRLVAAMRSHLETVRDLPELPKFRETRKLPQAFFEHFNAFLACYDELIEQVLVHTGDGKRIQCTAGCANCCIDLVRGLTTPEMINIYHHVRPWPDAKQLFEYHRESAETFSHMLLKRMMPGQPPTGDDDSVAEAHMEYNQLRRPCGFLDQEKGMCRIYPVRPIACRYFFSFDPPETCTPTHPQYFNRAVRLVHMPAEIDALLREVQKAFGFGVLNYLSGAFCEFTAQVMRIKLIEVE